MKTHLLGLTSFKRLCSGGGPTLSEQSGPERGREEEGTKFQKKERQKESKKDITRAGKRERERDRARESDREREREDGDGENRPFSPTLYAKRIDFHVIPTY